MQKTHELKISRRFAGDPLRDLAATFGDVNQWARKAGFTITPWAEAHAVDGARAVADLSDSSGDQLLEAMASLGVTRLDISDSEACRETASILLSVDDQHSGALGYFHLWDVGEVGCDCDVKIDRDNRNKPAGLVGYLSSVVHPDDRRDRELLEQLRTIAKSLADRDVFQISGIP